MALTRRGFLALHASAAARVVGPLVPFAGVQSTPLAGQLLGTMPLGRLDRQTPPLEQVLGSGLNGRLFTNLSTLSSRTPITPNERFFIRTEGPTDLPAPDDWSIHVGGLAERSQAIPLASLDALVRPTGTHLIECAGNADPTNFGLMSEARWEGIPVAAVLDRLVPLARQAQSILISGSDHREPTPTSQPGASWIFRRDELERTGAFLATTMNGVALSRDHGFPVRLVVPGWYGCSCIKWVTRLDIVARDAPATSQMREFAVRTHQSGVPAVASDYNPAEIDYAAMPVRVEKWRLLDGLVYRVVGLLWGGTRPSNGLLIRFGRSAPFEPVCDCPLPASTTEWTIWTHRWRPPEPGRYTIALRMSDPALRARRLDGGFYLREVAIDEV